jgi:hypothetical protein
VRIATADSQSLVIKLPMIPPISTEIDQHFGDPHWSPSIRESHGEPKMLIDFPSWESALTTDQTPMPPARFRHLIDLLLALWELPWNRLQKPLACPAKPLKKLGGVLNSVSFSRQFPKSLIVRQGFLAQNRSRYPPSGSHVSGELQTHSLRMQSIPVAVRQ